MRIRGATPNDAIAIQKLIAQYVGDGTLLPRSEVDCHSALSPLRTKRSLTGAPIVDADGATAVSHDDGGLFAKPYGEDVLEAARGALARG